MIGVAMVGVGYWGPNLLRNFDNLDISRVEWVVDSDQTRLNEVKQRYPHVATAQSIGPALEDSNVQAVVIATPTATHYQLVKAALENGKHVMVEKPITQTSGEATALNLLAEDRGLILMVGHVFIYNPAVRIIKQYLESGELGQIMRISMVRTNLGQVRLDVDAAWDLMPHDLSMLLYWLGRLPTEVTAHGASFLNPGIDDVVQATAVFPGPMIANIQVSWLDPIKDRGVRIVGDRKMLTWDDLNTDHPIQIHDIGIRDPQPAPGWAETATEFRSSIRRGPITIPVIDAGEPLAAECRHFLDCINSGQRPDTSAALAIDVIRILEAIDRSRANGSTLEGIGG